MADTAAAAAAAEEKKPKKPIYTNKKQQQKKKEEEAKAKVGWPECGRTREGGVLLQGPGVYLWCQGGQGHVGVEEQGRG